MKMVCLKCEHKTELDTLSIRIANVDSDKMILSIWVKCEKCGYLTKHYMRFDFTNCPYNVHIIQPLS